MALHLWGMENDNVPIPEPSPIDEIKLKPSQVIVLVEVYLPIYRDAIENQSVKKTLTIPQWLNKIAEENHVNFSQILQKALKEHLGINDRP